MSRRFNPRIVLTVVTEDSKSELSIVKGRLCGNGTISTGPSKEQIAIARKALLQIASVR